MKLLIAMGITTFCSIIGYGLTSYQRKRKDFFCVLLDLINYIKTEIRYGHKKVILIMKSAKLHNKDLCEIINNYVLCLENKRNIEDINFVFLEQEEKNMLVNFLNELGRYDTENQTIQLENYKQKIENLIEDNKNYIKKYGSLYLKLSVIIGLAISLLII